MRVLLVGGTGFIGSRLLRRLLDGGHHVSLALHRSRPEIPEGPALKYHSVDLLDPVGFRSAAFKADAAVNVAGQLRVPGLPDEHYWKVHYEATKHLLEESTRFRLKRLVLVSTTGVYGVTGRAPVAESGPIRPGDIYERTKWEAERYAREYSRGGEMDVVVARPSLVYGPGDRHLLGLFKAIRAGVFRLIGDGTNLLHPIFVDDLAEGLTTCLESPAASGGTFNLVGEEPVSFRRFGEAIAQALGRRLPSATLPRGLARGLGGLMEGVRAVTRLEMPLSRARVDFMTSDRAYDGRHAREVLGFRPATGLDEGMRRTVAWYRERGWL